MSKSVGMESWKAEVTVMLPSEGNITVTSALLNMIRNRVHACALGDMLIQMVLDEEGVALWIGGTE